MKAHGYPYSALETECLETGTGDVDNFEEKSLLNINEDWFFKAFLIRVRPAFGFKLPGTWSLKIVPEAEVYWTQL